MFSVSPTNSESTTSDVNASRPKAPDDIVKPMALSAVFRFLTTNNSPRPQKPPLRFLYVVRFSKCVSRLLLFGSAGFSLGRYALPANPKVLSTLMLRSNMNPSKFEWAVLFRNSRIRVRRGQVALLWSVPWNAPFGCSGKDIQKPFSSEPAATLSMKVLSGLVIQYDATVLSEGSRVSLPLKLIFLTSRRSSYL